MNQRIVEPKTSNGRQFPPGPSGLSALGSAFRQLGDNALDRYIDTWHKYGDIIYSRWGSLHTYMLAHPEDVHHVLVGNHKNYIKGVAYEGFRLVVGQGLITSEGELWRKQRRLMQPPFTATATLDFAPMMADVTRKLLAHWQETAGDVGAVLHVDDEMMRLTTGVIGRALFNIDLSEELTEVGYAFQDAFAFVPGRTMNPFSLPLALPLPSHRRFKKSMKLIERFVTERIAEKQQTPDSSLLSQLMEAEDSRTGYRMNDGQLRDEIVTLFFAGFETTARSLTWLWYRLARHPDIADRVAAEAREVLGGRLPTAEDLYRLTYARMVVDEVLRVYPPVAIMPRQNIEDDEIGGYHIPAGSLLLLMTYLVHRHPEYWDDPDSFNPDRFAPELAAERPKQAYVPFANGHRICLGNNFALLEMVIACAMGAERFRFRPVSDEEIPAKFMAVTTPSQPVEVYVERR